MSLTLFFAAVSLIHAFVLFITFRLPGGVVVYLVRAVLLALLFDNVILSLSAISFGQNWYLSASWLRYFAHVLVLPPLVVAAQRLTATAGASWASNRIIAHAAIGLSIAGIAIGIATELVDLRLVAETLQGHQRYVSTSGLPPIATIATNLIVLLLAAVIWRHSGWPWLFAGALSIFVINAAMGGSDWGIIAGNLAEVGFIYAWVATLFHFRQAAD